MAGVDYQVEGLTRLTATLGALAMSLPATAPPAAAQIIGQVARVNAPKRTGRLASSWASDIDAGSVGLEFGSSAVPYAGPQHWGVGPRAGLRGPHNIRASRFLIRAIDSTRSRWEDAYSQSIEKQLGKVQGA